MLKNKRINLLFISIFFVASFSVSAQMGHIMQGAGVINRSMEGAATGNPIDNCGVLYWNTAGLSRYKRTSICVSLEGFTNKLTLSSSAGLASGSDKSNFDPSAIPTLSLIYVPKNPDSRWRFGIGSQSVAGFGVDFSSSTTNPILAPQAAGGFGSVVSNFKMGQICFATSYQVTDKLALGFSPILSASSLAVKPFPATQPSLTGYPVAKEDWALGYGFQLALLYQVTDTFSFGLSYKSKQDFERFKYHGGANGGFTFNMDFPSIASMGVGYTGIKNLTVNIDLRHIDYEHTDGFSEPAEFDNTFAVKGFGWDSIWQVACGISYDLNEKWIIRCGYSYNQNPIDDKITFFNIHAPAIIQHHASIGFTYKASEQLFLNFGWSHGFKNSIEGPMVRPGVGALPGTRVKSEMSTDSLLIGFGYIF